MEILEIVKTLQIYTEDFVAYKMDSKFARAVTEAISLLVEQGERLADMESAWIPVTERLPDLIPCNAGTAYSEAVIVWTDGRKAMIAVWNGNDFICPRYYWDAWEENITHWMPLPEPPKEVE